MDHALTAKILVPSFPGPASRGSPVKMRKKELIGVQRHPSPSNAIHFPRLHLPRPVWAPATPDALVEALAVHRWRSGPFVARKRWT